MFVQLFNKKNTFLSNWEINLNVQHFLFISTENIPYINYLLGKIFSLEYKVHKKTEEAKYNNV